MPLTPGGLDVLAVDDERPALDELAYLLGELPEVGTIFTASDATGALRALAEHDVAAIFLDINMPGLSGLELAAVLGRYERPPAIVFVTAHEDRAVDAFDVGAVDYLLKPLRPERLAAALRRVVVGREPRPHQAGRAEPRPGAADADVIPVELGGVTTLVRRQDVGWVEAVGDYARLHARDGQHLVRITLSTLAERWAAAGFVRVHRSYLVSTALVGGLRTAGSGTTVWLRENGASPAVELPVSRRQTRELKDRIIRAPMRSVRADPPGRG